ncbi:MAG TPA: histidine triad nucleotide-binding protein [Gemmatimonadaceae bacterium]|jgi:histidine triad (HIT) family protein|nr:histidine triad nucleotide-binding protein [Gemmatimonadaceae bacterium]
MADNCLFCRIVRGEIPATVVAENEHALAFRDIGPQAPVHVLVIPKVHVASLNDLRDPLVMAQMTQMAVEVAQREGIAERGYRIVVNTNADGGQTVFHLHLHLLGGRHLDWPPG